MFCAPKIQPKVTGTPPGVGVRLLVAPRLKFGALPRPFSWEAAPLPSPGFVSETFWVGVLPSPQEYPTCPRNVSASLAFQVVSRLTKFAVAVSSGREI